MYIFDVALCDVYIPNTEEFVDYETSVRANLLFSNFKYVHLWAETDHPTLLTQVENVFYSCFNLQHLYPYLMQMNFIAHHFLLVSCL